MSKKIQWQIHRPTYGWQFDVTAPMRAIAVAIAEAKWLADNKDWCGAFTDSDGVTHPATPVPDFFARKA